ncbi:hypothetical protein [Spartinivicinus ruber]|uniref:hypothetical protein n=1 Tax=Spartinivicinus ruber TaxID=2683272 RepID=UPI0013D87BFC|nr:hypothetical protein [Spartinivicinus ruber]
MRVEFELTKEEVWNAITELHTSACIGTHSWLMFFVYYSRLGCFWIAQLVLLTFVFDKGQVELMLGVTIGLLVVAFVLSALSKYVLRHDAKKSYLSFDKGNFGIHTFELKEDKASFMTPGGLFEFAPSQVWSMVWTPQHFFIYTSLFSVYLPLYKVRKDTFEEMMKNIEQYTGKNIIKTFDHPG